MEMKIYSLLKISIYLALITFAANTSTVFAENTELSTEQEFQIAKSEEVYSVPEDYGKTNQNKYYSENWLRRVYFRER